jgi:hypothetical protein
MKNKELKKYKHTLGLENNLNDEEIDKIVNSQFRFAKEKIEELNNNNLNKNNKYNFNNIIFYFKRIGKIYLNNINNK